MNKSDLMNRLAEKKGFPLSTAKEIVDTVFDEMGCNCTFRVNPS